MDSKSCMPQETGGTTTDQDASPMAFHAVYAALKGHLLTLTTEVQALRKEVAELRDRLAKEE